MIVVLMGVSGSGKTTIGTVLAERVGALFADGDDYHPPSNKQKMAAGQPLTDADRQPWLETLNGLLRGWFESSQSGVLACSALKESYRTMLASGMPEKTVTFCLLHASKDLLAKRLAERHHEFMSPQLLDSQLATLELPADALIVENDRTPNEVADEILAAIATEKEVNRR